MTLGSAFSRAAGQRARGSRALGMGAADRAASRSLRLKPRDPADPLVQACSRSSSGGSTFTVYAGRKGASRAPTGRLPRPRGSSGNGRCRGPMHAHHPSTLRRDRLGLVQGTELVRAEARPEPRCSDSRSGTRGCRKPWPPSRGLRGDGMAGHHPHPVLECLPAQD